MRQSMREARLAEDPLGTILRRPQSRAKATRQQHDFEGAASFWSFSSDQSGLARGQFRMIVKRTDLPPRALVPSDVGQVLAIKAAPGEPNNIHVRVVRDETRDYGKGKKRALVVEGCYPSDTHAIATRMQGRNAADQ